MKTRLSRTWTTAMLALAAFARLGISADATNTTSQPAEIATKTAGTNSIPLKTVPDFVLKGLAQEDVFNSLADPLLKKIFDSKDPENGLLQFLRDLNIRPKVFQSKGGGSNDTSLGLEFDY